MSYIPLSSFGGYRLKMSGHFRPFRLASEDVFIWQPRFGTCYPFQQSGGNVIYRKDYLGLLYLPMIYLDQNLVHRTRPWLSIDQHGKMQFLPFPPFELMHPYSQIQIRISNEIIATHKQETEEAVARHDQQAQKQIARQIFAEIERRVRSLPQ